MDIPTITGKKTTHKNELFCNDLKKKKYLLTLNLGNN